jgi:hypothetical protein
MDADRFEAMLRALAVRPSRRDLARRLSGLALAGPIAALGLSSAVAKRRKKKKKKKSPPPPPLNCPGGCGNETCCLGSCTNLASNSANCGACGHTCATGLCVNGACDCLFLAANCPATCSCAARIQAGSVCNGGGGGSVSCTTDADCPVGTACLVTNVCSAPCLV